jgi:hypothetical protein
MKKIVLIFICLTFLGCVTAKVKTPDGMKVEYSSYGDKQLKDIEFKKTKAGFYFKLGTSHSTEQDITVPGIVEIK